MLRNQQLVGPAKAEQLHLDQSPGDDDGMHAVGSLGSQQDEEAAKVLHLDRKMLRSGRFPGLPHPIQSHGSHSSAESLDIRD